MELYFRYDMIDMIICYADIVQLSWQPSTRHSLYYNGRGEGPSLPRYHGGDDVIHTKDLYQVDTNPNRYHILIFVYIDGVP